MSTATEITRLQTARNTIRDKLIEFGLATSTAKLDALATAVDGIENKGAVSKTLDATNGNQSYTVPAGYHNGEGTVTIALESKTVVPTEAVQNIAPTAGKVLSTVTVSAIPNEYANVSKVTATSEKVLEGASFVSSQGTIIEGMMPNNNAVAATIDGLTNTSYTIPKGYHSGSGTVSLTNDIETALAAI